MGSFCRSPLHYLHCPRAPSAASVPVRPSVAAVAAPVDQPERAKSNQCDPSPTSIAFSGATITDDDDDAAAVAHIIFYGSPAQQCDPLGAGLRAISTRCIQKENICLPAPDPRRSLSLNRLSFASQDGVQNHETATWEMTPQPHEQQRGHSVRSRLRSRERTAGVTEGERKGD